MNSRLSGDLTCSVSTIATGSVTSRRRFTLLSTMVALAVCILLSATSGAQTAATGAIAGVITDPSGASVANANVKITSEETGDTRSAMTGANGSFVVSLLPPGQYTVRASKQGFKELVRTGVSIHVTETAVANLQLIVGANTEIVSITAEGALLDTEDAALGKVTDERIVSSLPLVTRNYTQIIGLSPGVSTEVTNASQLGRGAGSDDELQACAHPCKPHWGPRSHFGGDPPFALARIGGE